MALFLYDEKCEFVSENYYITIVLCVNEINSILLLLNFPSLKTAAKAAYSSQTTIYL